MRDPRQIGLEDFSAIPRKLIEKVQKDLADDKKLRRDIVAALTATNFGFAVTVLSGAQAANLQQLSPDEAYSLGAYLIVGVLMKNGQLTALNEILNAESAPAPEDKFLAATAGDPHDDEVVQPEA
jgi:hypothetical protein